MRVKRQGKARQGKARQGKARQGKSCGPPSIARRAANPAFVPNLHVWLRVQSCGIHPTRRLPSVLFLRGERTGGCTSGTAFLRMASDASDETPRKFLDFGKPGTPGSPFDLVGNIWKSAEQALVKPAQSFVGAAIGAITQDRAEKKAKLFVTKLQARYRGRLARRQAAEKAEQAEKLKHEVSATKLQAGFRGHHARLEVEKRALAARIDASDGQKSTPPAFASKMAIFFALLVLCAGLLIATAQGGASPASKQEIDVKTGGRRLNRRRRSTLM